MGSTVLDLTDVELSLKDDSGLRGVDVVDDEKGIVTAIVSVTGVKDRVNDIIHPGAYSESLKVRTPKGLKDHDWKTLVSKALEVKELMPGDPGLPSMLSDGSAWPADAGALMVKAQYNLETQAGREAYSNAKFFGEKQEWSIGYSVPKTKDASFKDDKGIRHIKRLDLFEFSQVLWGAMPHARTTDVKSEDLVLEFKDGEFKGLKEKVALEDGSYPIQTTADLESAIKLRNHGKAGKEKIYAHIKRCAGMLGRRDLLPDDMKTDKTEETKDDNKKEQENIVTDIKTLVLAWQQIAKVLHEAGEIDDVLYIKCADMSSVEVKTLDTAVGVITAYKDIFDEDEIGEAKSLARIYDFALDMKDDKAIDKAQDTMAEFLAAKHASGVDIRPVASALLSLHEDDEEESEDPEKDGKKDDPELIEKKDDAEPVVMSRADFMAFLGK